jgi:hypothetical protein
MTVKGAMIAALAAGYMATAAPVAANAGDAEKGKTATGEKASCKGGGGCKAAKGKGKKAKKEGDKAEGDKAPEAEKPAEPAPAK